MIVDAHGHACASYGTLELIVQNTLRNGIDRVVLFPGDRHKTVSDHMPDGKNKEILYFTNPIGAFLARFMNIPPIISQGNQYIHELKKQAPEKIIQFYQIVPTNLDRLEKDFAEMRFDGIKLHQCVQYFSIRSAFFEAVLDFAEKHDLPVQIHLNTKKDAVHLVEMLKKHRVRLIVAHLLYYPVFAEAWAEIGERTWFDLASYYFINRESILKALQLFGPEKLVFGSDNPFGPDSIEKTLGMVRGLPLTDEEKMAVLGGNILRVLGR